MIAIKIFLLGLISGSFLNVVIYRLPKNQSIITPASHCPECGTRLGLPDLVPVLSFLLYRGRCRYCGAKISWQYPLVELLTGVLFLLLYLKFGLTVKFAIYILLTSLLIVCSAIDIRYKIIPNKITYSGIITGLLLALIFNHINIISSLLGAVIPGGFLLLIALFYKKGLGMGDVKLVAMIGVFTGYEIALAGIFVGAFIGSVVILTLIGLGIVEWKSRIPFGPFISGGSFIAFYYGRQFLDWYFNLFI